MNSCILMAKVIRAPELRYTQENQTPVAQMLVEFEGTRTEDPTATLKVVGWGNLASEIQTTYSEGDQVIIEGRLSMYSFDRPEGFKEKRAELIASRIYRLEGGYQLASDTTNPSPSEEDEESPSSDRPMAGVVPDSPLESEPIDRNLDDIPF